MKVSVELLRWREGEQPKVLHRIIHESHSLETVAAALRNVLNSPEISLMADGYRIVTEAGTELYGWPDAAKGRSRHHPVTPRA
jgi:hypothetical protein